MSEEFKQTQLENIEHLPQDEWQPVELLPDLHKNQRILEGYKRGIEAEHKAHNLGHENEDLTAELKQSNETLVAVTEQLTDKNDRIEELEQESLTNPVTGLPNRRAMDRKLNEIFSNELKPNSMAVVIIDLDGFKQINDTYGHETGDNVLKEVGKQLQKIVREGDIVYHFGGDEFAVIMPTFKREEQKDFDDDQIINNVINNVRFATEFGARIENVIGSSSVGVALNEENDIPEEIFNRADRSMYLDKRDKEERLAKLAS